MLVTFKSKASGSVRMFGDVATQLLDVIGKPLTDKGIITVEELPDAIARLRQAAGESKTRTKMDDGDDSETAQTDSRGPSVSLAQRAVPLIELFEYALKAKEPVLWGI